MDLSALPFNRSLGLCVSADQQGVDLLPRTEHGNHLGTVHATVLFGVAEAASAQRLLCTFPTVASGYNVTLRSSDVKYRRAARINERLEGKGLVDEDTEQRFYERLMLRGRSTVTVVVTVAQDSVVVAEGAFTWLALAIESNA